MHICYKHNLAFTSPRLKEKDERCAVGKFPLLAVHNRTSLTRSSPSKSILNSNLSFLITGDVKEVPKKD